jgi:hypothetical protein
VAIGGKGNWWVVVGSANGVVERRFVERKLVCHLSTGYRTAGNWRTGPLCRPALESRKWGRWGNTHPLQKCLLGWAVVKGSIGYP